MAIFHSYVKLPEGRSSPVGEVAEPLATASTRPGFLWDSKALDLTGWPWSEPITNIHQYILVGGLEHFLFSHILGITIPIDFHIFQSGWNLQQVSNGSGSLIAIWWMIYDIHGCLGGGTWNMICVFSHSVGNFIITDSYIFRRWNQQPWKMTHWLDDFPS